MTYFKGFVTFTGELIIGFKSGKKIYFNLFLKLYCEYMSLYKQVQD